MCWHKASTDISDETLCAVIEQEVKEPSALKGFRNIWNKIRVTYGITVPRDRVMFRGVLESYIKIVWDAVSQNPDLNSNSNSEKLVLIEVIRWEKVIPN